VPTQILNGLNQDGLTSLAVGKPEGRNNLPRAGPVRASRPFFSRKPRRTLASRDYGKGGVLSPWPLSPQQATVPSLFRPQVWLAPATTWVKVPVGGVLWP
jgi:hypothetical protein